MCCSERDDSARGHRGTEDQFATDGWHKSSVRHRRRSTGTCLPGERQKPRRTLERARVLRQGEKRPSETPSRKNRQGCR